jgi:uncharacterized damage-inducible protein DinB
LAHPLVDQLRFTRSELMRSLDGVTEEEAATRFPPMNCLSWMLGHLADQEQRYWLALQGDATVAPRLNALVGHGKPASTPSLKEMREAWKTVIAAVDPFLDRLTVADLLALPPRMSAAFSESNGTLMQRVIYHYWFHIGESQAVRQLLGHVDLPQFVGDLGRQSPYRPENDRGQGA